MQSLPGQIHLLPPPPDNADQANREAAQSASTPGHHTLSADGVPCVWGDCTRPASHYCRQTGEPFCGNHILWAILTAA